VSVLSQLLCGVAKCFVSFGALRIGEQGPNSDGDIDEVNHTVSASGMTLCPWHNVSDIRGCIQKFHNWPPGARTVNGTALCH
jgi:hypothetical protein